VSVVLSVVLVVVPTPFVQRRALLARTAHAADGRSSNRSTNAADPLEHFVAVQVGLAHGHRRQVRKRRRGHGLADASRQGGIRRGASGTAR
jgi:hypothetical protein